ncbi:MAG: hypothetical protein WCD69_27080, partial [Xanthobacteraceae bacterium]
MIARTYAEDAQPIEQEADRDGLEGHAGPEYGDARQVNEHKRNGRRIHDVVVLDDRRSTLLVAHKLPSWGYPKSSDRNSRDAT